MFNPCSETAIFCLLNHWAHLLQAKTNTGLRPYSWPNISIFQLTHTGKTKRILLPNACSFALTPVPNGMVLSPIALTSFPEAPQNQRVLAASSTCIH